MNIRARAIAATLFAGAWVNASEFFRNELLLGSRWAAHYAHLGMAFPSAPVNGIIWGLWGFIFAAGTYLVSRQLSLFRTALLCWVFGFVLMWLVTWNLQVLPVGILVYAVPLSMIEVLVSAFICFRVDPPCASK